VTALAHDSRSLPCAQFRDLDADRSSLSVRLYGPGSLENCSIFSGR
jgi:hypothetical protein